MHVAFAQFFAKKPPKSQFRRNLFRYRSSSIVAQSEFIKNKMLSLYTHN